MRIEFEKGDHDLLGYKTVMDVMLELKKVWGRKHPELKKDVNNFRAGNDYMLNMEEIAQYMSVKKSWIYQNWEREGIPLKKLGGQLSIRKKELDKWIDSR